MRILTTILLCLVLTTAAAAADRTVTITPLEQPSGPAGLAAPAGVCVFGNTNAPAYAITDWIWGAESYATVFPAIQPTCGCAGGFNIEQVHFYMQFGAADVPSSFNAYVDFRETAFDAVSGCSVPGSVICASPSYTVTITNAGLYDIALPLDPAGCACAYFGYDYAVGINFTTVFPTAGRPSAITDAAPVGCTSWNDYGAGWDDLGGYGLPGELTMFADVVCCEPPVPGAAPSWGDLKSRFR